MPESATLQVKVVPGASRDKVAGWLGTELKVTVAAPPESGKANAAVIALLAGVLSIPSRNILIAGGQTRPRKTLAFSDITQQELLQRLTSAGFPPPKT